MRTIWKYLVPVDGIEVQLWEPRVVLVAHDPAVERDEPSVWIEHTLTDDPMVQFAITQFIKPPRLQFRFVGTGHAYSPADGEHVGSAICGEFVWHVLSRQVNVT